MWPERIGGRMLVGYDPAKVHPSPSDLVPFQLFGADTVAFAAQGPMAEFAGQQTTS
jgi:hypothetical protein